MKESLEENIISTKPTDFEFTFIITIRGPCQKCVSLIWNMNLKYIFWVRKFWFDSPPDSPVIRNIQLSTHSSHKNVSQSFALSSQSWSLRAGFKLSLSFKAVFKFYRSVLRAFDTHLFPLLSTSSQERTGPQVTRGPASTLNLAR